MSESSLLRSRHYRVSLFLGADTRWPHSLAFSFMLVSCVVLLSGCAARISPVREFRGDAAAASVARTQEEEFQKRWAPLRSLRALYRARIEEGERSNSMRYAVIASLPDRLRIEVLPPAAGYALGILVINGSSTTLVDVPSKSAILGMDPRSAIRRFINIPLAPSEVAALLLGRVPESGASWRWYRRQGTPGWYRERSDGLVDAVLSETTLRPEMVTLRDPFRERDVMTVHFTAWREMHGKVVPDSLKILFEEHSAVLTMSVRSLDLGPEISAEAFGMQIPADYEIRREE